MRKLVMLAGICLLILAIVCIVVAVIESSTNGWLLGAITFSFVGGFFLTLHGFEGHVPRRADD